MSVASLFTTCFVMFCVILYGPFCHGAHKLDLSTLFTTFFLWTSPPFILLNILNINVCCAIAVTSEIILNMTVYINAVLRCTTFFVAFLVIKTHAEYNVPVPVIKVNFTRGHSLSFRHTTVQTGSIVKCAKMCLEGEQYASRFLGYNMATNICELSDNIQQDIVSGTDDEAVLFCTNQGIRASLLLSIMFRLKKRNVSFTDKIIIKSQYVI